MKTMGSRLEKKTTTPTEYAIEIVTSARKVGPFTHQVLANQLHSQLRAAELLSENLARSKSVCKRSNYTRLVMKR